MERSSLYHDNKEKLLAQDNQYIQHHPELNHLIQDFIAATLRDKPNQIELYAKQYFEKFIPNNNIDHNIGKNNNNQTTILNSVSTSNNVNTQATLSSKENQFNANISSPAAMISSDNPVSTVQLVEKELSTAEDASDTDSLEEVSQSNLHEDEEDDEQAEDDEEAGEEDEDEEEG
jgi:hypothetical protein